MPDHKATNATGSGMVFDRKPQRNTNLKVYEDRPAKASCSRVRSPYIATWRNCQMTGLDTKYLQASSRIFPRHVRHSNHYTCHGKRCGNQPMLRQPTRRSHRLLLLTSLICCFILLHALRKSWWTGREADLEAFSDENDSCGRFESNSPFRKYPNHDLEQRIDSALAAIQRREELEHPPTLPSKRIWQTWRDDTVPKDFDQPAVWRELNPGWEHNFVSDQKASDLVANELATVPGFQHLFSLSDRPILRADLLRYTLLWRYGGFYADIDVHPVCSIESCKPLLPLFAGDENPNISLVVGVEIDEPYASLRRRKYWRWDKTHGFIQYTMYAPRPFSPVLRRAIVRSIAHSVRHEEEQMSWYRWASRFDRTAVLQITGPGMFTDAILDVLSETLPSNHSLKTNQRQKEACPGDHPVRSDHEQRERVTWAPFHRLVEPYWIEDEGSMIGDGFQGSGGVGVLPINVWGNGQRHSGSENFFSSKACVNHHFSGTWKKSWLHRSLLKRFHV